MKEIRITIPANDHHGISPKKSALRFTDLDISCGWRGESGILSSWSIANIMYASMYLSTSLRTLSIYVCIYKGFRNNTLNRNISNIPSPPTFLGSPVGKPYTKHWKLLLANISLVVVRPQWTILYVLLWLLRPPHPRTRWSGLPPRPTSGAPGPRRVARGPRHRSWLRPSASSDLQLEGL